MLYSPGDLVKTYQFRRYTEKDVPAKFRPEVQGFPYTKKEILENPEILHLCEVIPEGLPGQVIDTMDNVSVSYPDNSYLNLAQVLIGFKNQHTGVYWFFEEELIHLDYTPL